MLRCHSCSSGTTSPHCKCPTHWDQPPELMPGSALSLQADSVIGTINATAPTNGTLSPTTFPSLQDSAALSAFSLQVHHTSDHSLQVQGANGHKSEPPSLIDYCK
ncbi:hypothetical protein EMCRGX_G033153 [Ephydatia muelleri]